MKVVVTGGAGFIGSALCRYLVAVKGWQVVNVDALTYAANLASLSSIEGNPSYRFVKADICDRAAMDRVLAECQPDAIMHLAAESHVDRSITGSAEFITTNIVGTHTLLEAARAYWGALAVPRKSAFRFLHVSTDEVYGSLGDTGFFTEETPLHPNSPYSASKAGADMLAQAYQHTFDMPIVITRCSNNYGPYQFPEKLIPLFITNLMHDEPVPVYGDGQQVRDWIHVHDHCTGVEAAWRTGRPGEVYNFGGRCEMTNLDLTFTLLDLLGKPRTLIRYVKDRPGHDRRYAIDCAKAERELGWSPKWTFEKGIRDTIAWYQDHQGWIDGIKTKEYLSYYEKQYGTN